MGAKLAPVPDTQCFCHVNATLRGNIVPPTSYLLQTIPLSGELDEEIFQDSGSSYESHQ